MRKIANFFGLNKTPGRVNLLAGIGYAFWAYPSTAGNDVQIAGRVGISPPTRYTGTSPDVPSWMVMTTQTETVVAFAGTTEVSQWMAYLTSLGVSGCGSVGGRTFAPFETWANEIAGRLVDQITATGPIAFVGHSAGGAMAHLVAAKICAQMERLAVVYTCGCPYLGDDEFTRLYRPVGHNVLQVSDLVTLLPPSALSSRLYMPLGQTLLPPMYRSGRDWLLPGSGKIAPNPAGLVIPAAPLLWARNLPAGVIESHTVGGYFKRAWDLLDFEDKALASAWAGVASTFWGLDVTPV